MAEEDRKCRMCGTIWLINPETGICVTCEMEHFLDGEEEPMHAPLEEGEPIIDSRFTTCVHCGVFFHAGAGAVYIGTRTNIEGNLVDCYLCERCGRGEGNCEEEDEDAD